MLSPGLAEVLTGSTPIGVLLLDPVQLVISVAGLLALYGGGVLLVREAWVRWGRGWGSVLLLGAAYGILEEGVAVHTFFAPSSGVVHALGSFGHWAGVNWVWAVGLTVFHSLYSITLPILLVDLYLPESHGRRLVQRRGLLLILGAYVAVVGLFAAVTPFGPSPALLLGTLAVAGVLVVAAYRLPPGALRPARHASTSTPFGLALAGSLSFSFWIFVTVGGVPRVVSSSYLAIGLVLALPTISYLYLYATLGGEFAPEARFWTAVGLAVPLLAWAFLIDFTIPGPAVAAVALIWWLHHLRRRLRAGTRGPAVIRGPSAPAA